MRIYFLGGLVEKAHLACNMARWDETQEPSSNNLTFRLQSSGIRPFYSHIKLNVPDSRSKPNDNYKKDQELISVGFELNNRAEFGSASQRKGHR